MRPAVRAIKPFVTITVCARVVLRMQPLKSPAALSPKTGYLCTCAVQVKSLQWQSVFTPRGENDTAAQTQQDRLEPTRGLGKPNYSTELDLVKEANHRIINIITPHKSLFIRCSLDLMVA